MAALAKVLAICAGTVGGAAACVATGVAPSPLDIVPQHATKAKIERISERAIGEIAPPMADEPAPPPAEAPTQPAAVEPKPVPEPTATVVTPEATEAGAVEYEPPAEPASSPPPESSAASSGSSAGEFGP